MCLYIDKQKTEIEKFDTSPRTFYKLFLKGERTLQTPYMRQIIEGPGIFKAPPPSTAWLDYNKGMIGPGAFHARTTKEALKFDIFWIEQFELGFCVFLEIPVQASHIIAFGSQDNVTFSEYSISHAMWDEALSKKKSTTLKDIKE